jgi:hypothetical protein
METLARKRYAMSLVYSISTAGCPALLFTYQSPGRFRSGKQPEIA